MSKPKVEVVSHCWAKRYRHYADFLQYQLSSFVLYPAKDCDVLVSIYCVEDDVLTNDVLDYFKDKMNLNIVHMKNDAHMGKRGIGRNQAALNTEADFVWFTDVDFVFRGECFDGLVSLECTRRTNGYFIIY